MADIELAQIQYTARQLAARVRAPWPAELFGVLDEVPRPVAELETPFATEVGHFTVLHLYWPVQAALAKEAQA